MYDLCMIFPEKFFLCNILLTDQILLSEYLYFMRYWAICVDTRMAFEVYKFDTRIWHMLVPVWHLIY